MARNCRGGQSAAVPINQRSSTRLVPRPTKKAPPAEWRGFLPGVCNYAASGRRRLRHHDGVLRLPSGLVHLLPLRRRLRLQPLDRVQDASSLRSLSGWRIGLPRAVHHLSCGPKLLCWGRHWLRGERPHATAPQRQCRSGSRRLTQCDRRNPGSSSDRPPRPHRQCARHHPDKRRISRGHTGLLLDDTLLSAKCQFGHCPSAPLHPPSAPLPAAARSRSGSGATSRRRPMSSKEKAPPGAIGGAFRSVGVGNAEIGGNPIHTPQIHNAQRVRKFRPFSRAVYRRSQLQKQIASRRRTVQVTGLSGPTTNCITGLCLALNHLPLPIRKIALLKTTNAAIANSP